MDTIFGLSSFTFLKIIAEAVFRVINTMKTGNLYVKNGLL